MLIEKIFRINLYLLVKSLPSISIFPDVGDNSPKIILMRVVFPEPVSPTNHMQNLYFLDLFA